MCGSCHAQYTPHSIFYQVLSLLAKSCLYRYPFRSKVAIYFVFMFSETKDVGKADNLSICLQYVRLWSHPLYKQAAALAYERFAFT